MINRKEAKQTKNPQTKPNKEKKPKPKHHTKTILLCILLNSRVTLKFCFAKMKFKLRTKSNENKRWKSILKVQQINKDHWRVSRIILDSIKKALKLFCFCDWQLDFIWLRATINLRKFTSFTRRKKNDKLLNFPCAFQFLFFISCVV